MSFLNPFDKHGPGAGALAAHALGLGALALSLALAACEGCKSAPGAGRASEAKPAGDAANASPSVRLYLVSDLAGALEPCGCTKDQLGGLDHAAAWMRAQHPSAPNAALVSSGPLFFMDAKLKDDHRDQDVAKAETIAASLPETSGSSRSRPA